MLAVAPDIALQIRTLGHADYTAVWNAMRAFTAARTPQTPDEVWLVEHAPVFTMGLKGRGGSVHEIDGIPLVYTDRGGDITYHGPGQIMLYVLLDVGRLGIGIKTLVQSLEQTVVDYLAAHRIDAGRRAGAPGVYVHDKKIAALGLRIRNGRSYHGLALNVNMDLAPFSRIDPCGYEGLQVTQLADFGIGAKPAAAGLALAERLTALLGYNSQPVTSDPIDLAQFAASSHE